MIIKSIKLENFRNYESLELSFEKGTNILYGDNAQGKTNVLEAVYLSDSGRRKHISARIWIKREWNTELICI